MIYLDYNASTPLDPTVHDAMLPYLREHYGNPSSPHALGRRLRAVIDSARAEVAAMLDADPDEVYFTSGGTEANNWVVKGVAAARAQRGRHIIISAIEHPSISKPCQFLAQHRFETTLVPPDHTGRIDVDEIISEVRPDTILISIMHANNEIGTIQPIAEIADAAREGGILMHTDAAQSCGKIPVRVSELHVDFLTLAGHKFYAPQGIGALYIRKGTELESFHHGAGHERGMRAGTEPVANIVGLGKAAELVRKSPDAAARLKSLRDRLQSGLTAKLGASMVVHGSEEHRLPNTLSAAFLGRKSPEHFTQSPESARQIGASSHGNAAELLKQLPDLCVSLGAACHGNDVKPSAVLKAIGVPDDLAAATMRLSVGRFTTEVEIDQAIEMLTRAVWQ